MTETTLSIIISIAALLIAIVSFFVSKNKKQPVMASAGEKFNSVPLQLQAYERLAVLCERIAIPNLISRVNHPLATAKEMQALMIENIKQEFEYNASQQIY